MADGSVIIVGIAVLHTEVGRTVVTGVPGGGACYGYLKLLIEGLPGEIGIVIVGNYLTTVPEAIGHIAPVRIAVHHHLQVGVVLIIPPVRFSHTRTGAVKHRVAILFGSDKVAPLRDCFAAISQGVRGELGIGILKGEHGHSVHSEGDNFHISCTADGGQIELGLTVGLGEIGGCRSCHRELAIGIFHRPVVAADAHYRYLTGVGQCDV